MSSERGTRCGLTRERGEGAAAGRRSTGTPGSRPRTPRRGGLRGRRRGRQPGRREDHERWTDAAKKKIMDTRKVATHDLVGAIERLATKPRVLVSQSAVGYYGNRGDETLDETSAPGDSFDASVCVEWEKAAHEVEAAGVRLVIVRTGQVMETEGGILGELLLPFKLGLGGPLAGRRAVGALDPPLRRGRHPRLGARHRERRAASSTAPHRTRSPTRSGRRRSARPWDARPCCRSPASRSS